jgi:preprotein translocase subunit SecD
MKRRSPIIFTLIFALIALISYVSAFGLNLGDYRINSLGSGVKQGLDLKGGVYVVVTIQDKNVNADMVDRTIQLIKERIDKFGVVDPTVVKEGSNRIRIEIPGMNDQKQALELIGKTGYLKFTAPDGSEILNGKDIKNAYVSIDSYNKPVVSLEMNEDGTKKFAAATQKYVNQKISIYLDEDLLTDPVVKTAIPDGKAVIEGMESTETAKRIASLIKSGALPVTLKAENVRLIGPSLGSDALQRSILAGIVGISLALIFMLVYYKLPGLIADMALIIYIILTILVFVLFKVTLTLPGISGLLLTIGMAVDANVLIFERIKEELKMGKTLHAALNAGFDRALTAIIDSNVTTIISGIVLAIMGTGPIKGFAVTLIIGVIISMLTAVVVTRFLLGLVIDIKALSKPKYYGA